MARVWFCFQRLLTSPCVPVLYEFRVSAECFCGRELFWFEFAPQSRLRFTESSEPAFGRNSSAGESNNFLGLAQRSNESGRKFHHAVAPEDSALPSPVFVAN